MQLALYEAGEAGRASEIRPAAEPGRPGQAPREGRRASHASHLPRMCAACRAREARYGFRDERDDDPTVARSRTLCFDCFRIEMDRRRLVAAQRARGWNATQPELPLAERLDALTRRRGRAQIAARRALNLR